MSVVLDCSIAVNWLLPDESSDFADELLERVSFDGGTVPLLFRIEVGNALLMAVRRKRITADLRRRAFDRISQLRLEYDEQGIEYVWTSCVDLANTHGLSLYDATYLELARRRGLALATFDARLAQAARRAGVSSPFPDA